MSLTKAISVKRTNQELNLYVALWVYQMLNKVAIRCTSFKLVYGLKFTMSWEFLVPILIIVVAKKWDSHKLNDHVHMLVWRRNVLCTSTDDHGVATKKQWFDCQLKDKNNNVGDMVLLLKLIIKNGNLNTLLQTYIEFLRLSPKGPFK